MRKKNSRFKKHITNWRLGDYLRQLSVVVLGIIITFMGSTLISNYITQHKLKTALKLMVTELEVNREYAISMKARYDKEHNFGKYLDKYKNDFAKASDDTLELNRYVFFQLYEPSSMTEAFEMLKTSGLLQEISDQSLIIKILTTYRNIEYACSNYQFYYSNKGRITEMLNDYPDFQSWYGKIDFQNMPARQIFEHLMHYPIFTRLYQLPSGCINSKETFTPAINSTSETINLLKSTYNL